MSPTDEIFTFLQYRFNVDKFRRMLSAKPQNFTMVSGKARDWIGANALIGIDKQHAEALTDEQLRQPLYFVKWRTVDLLIDGHHRLHRLHSLDPDLTVKAWVMPKRLVPMILLPVGT